ncbi:FAD-binding oxidoreductase [Nocardia bovistercoris]|uniref:FAD-binding protein n=1 Tax=Nocardia bovistercoris TaxID=2785916 RepID=A0A931N2K2_9NOCA|nr:FAD-binding protein [Nocardia bovistercoris]MBH0776812.1 FAD-binding protein [Nocardia bovistercoris]
MPLSRRSFLAAPMVGAAATALGAGAANAADVKVVRAGEAEYAALTTRGYNRRFTARPRQIFVPANAEEVRVAVERSVGDGLPLAVRSGGHGFDDFVDNDRTGAIVDLQRLAGVSWDESQRAFAVEPGADLGSVYERLLGGWGVTVPAGICKGVGAGGHVSGGGYGPLSRRFGLVADHLYGVEVVTVDARGSATTVLATKDGPHADLWWAHTGGGGGNFGVVTKYLLRSPEADGADPARALPKPPGSMLNTRLVLPLATEESFIRFVGNYLAFFEQHSAPDDPFAGLYAPLHIRPGIAGPSDVLILLDADRPDAGALFDEFVAAVSRDVVPGPVVLPPTTASYADTLANVYYAKGMPGFRVKVKSAYLRTSYSTDQLRTLYRYLTDIRFLGESQLEFMPFGGRTNAVAPDATAVSARDSFMKMLVHAAWRVPGDDERYVAWAREMFRDVYAGTGGVPAPNAANGGSYINYPDPDMADPRWNTSGVPWHTLYYGANYPRLTRVKAQYDPANLFQHKLSVGRPDW